MTTVVGHLYPSRPGQAWLVEVVCPHCGCTHTHGAGIDGRTLGHRTAHCGKGGYVIVGVVL